MRKREMPLLRGIPPLAGIIQPRDGARWCGWREAGPMLAEDFEFIVTPEDLRLEEEESLFLFGPETPDGVTEESAKRPTRANPVRHPESTSPRRCGRRAVRGKQ